MLRSSELFHCLTVLNFSDFVKKFLEYEELSSSSHLHHEILILFNSINLSLNINPDEIKNIKAGIANPHHFQNVLRCYSTF